MSELRAIDTLFPLLLKSWKQSWVEATNSAGELKCKVEQAWGDGYENGEELIAAMDAAGVQTILATDLLAWSYPRQTRFANDTTSEIAEMTKKYPGRVYGLADYDPFHIRASLEKVERDVKEHGYKGIYLHIYGYDIGLDHRKMYPLYALCESLGIAVSMQIGHVLEAMPSEHGRPIQLDRIACDFPDLTLVGTHTGWPWVEEALAVISKWPNVYLSTSAWLPKYFSPTLLAFLNSRVGSQKILFGSNGLDWQRYLDQWAELGLREDSSHAMLFENPKRVFKLD
ncbi:MAG: amidohydrolase family protein [Deltaproteobacteria bacterium]|nr:amidohydrolase family protein [Deltaproteobacteria bacterium]